MLPVVIILLAACLRLLPHAPNFTPIAAMALFGGYYLPKRYALALPLLAMVLSDVFLGFHATIPFVYGSFILSGMIGMTMKKHPSFLAVGASTLLSSVLFFLLTNFGVWVSGTLYAKNASGLAEAYLMGIPFFRNTVCGDLFYTLVFFGGYAVFRKGILFRNVTNHA
jgi:hypothetical protein